MALDEKKYRELKRRAEQAQSEADQAKGALKQLTDRLRNEFSCKDLGEAKRKLSTMEAELETAEKDYEKALAAYEKKWSPDAIKDND